MKGFLGFENFEKMGKLKISLQHNESYSVLLKKLYRYFSFGIVVNACSIYIKHLPVKNFL